MPSTGEPTHVGPYLGQDHLCQAPLDPWDGHEPLDLLLIGAQALSNLGAHAFDGFIQGINVCQLLAQEKAMVRLQLTLERLREQIAFGAHPAFGKFSQDAGIDFSSEQSRQHVTR